MPCPSFSLNYNAYEYEKNRCANVCSKSELSKYFGKNFFFFFYRCANPLNFSFYLSKILC